MTELKKNTIHYQIEQFKIPYYIALKKYGAEYKNPSGTLYNLKAAIKPDFGGDCVTFREGNLWATPCTNISYVACENM
jgi:hypothetical protein